MPAGGLRDYAEGALMHIAYLTNQYPTVSHTFIRREIEALEALGAKVERFSVRRMRASELPDPHDQRESARTDALLAEGARGLAGPTTRMLARRPEAFARAQKLALSVGAGSERGLLRHFAYLGEACRLVEELERRGVQHLHAHFGTNSATVAMFARELGGPSYSFTVHGPEEFDKPAAIALPEKIARAAFVVGVSSFGRSQLYRYCPAREWSKVHTVRCGVDDAYLALAPTPVPETKRLVSVGRLCEQKGQLLLVEAAAQLKRAGLQFELVLVGDGPMRPEVEAAVARHDLGDTVRITGWASGQAVREAIEASRALVLPSFAEGLPVVIMEALARARPVISTYIAGIPELVREDCGWLVPAGSIEAVAEAMQSALSADHEALTAMGLKGRERVGAMHSAKHNAAQLLALFERYAAA